MKLKTLVLAFGIIMAMSCTVFAESTVEDVESAVEVVADDAVEEVSEEVESAVEEVKSAAEDVESETTEETETDAEGTEIVDAVDDTKEKKPRPQFNALDYIVLGDYKGLEVEVPKIDITDEQIDEEIAYDMEYFEDAHEHITEGEVENGDTINIDYVGKIDGKEFDGGSDEGFDLEIGSGTFIEGFEDKLIGAKIGDVVDVALKFPDDYFEESVAGKDVVFTVTINYKDKVKELDDALVSKMTDGECKTVDEYRTRKAKELEDMAKEDNAYDAKVRLIEMAMDAAVIDEYPQELVDYYKEEASNYYKEYADMMGAEYEAFIEEQEIDIDEIAEATVKNDFVIDAIAEAEGLVPTEEEMPDAYQALADEYGFESVESMQSEYDDEDILYNILYDRVVDFLYNNAKIIEVMEEEMEPADDVVLTDEDFDVDVQVENDETQATEEPVENPSPSEVPDGVQELVGDTSAVASGESVAESTAESVTESVVG